MHTSKYPSANLEESRGAPCRNQLFYRSKDPLSRINRFACSCFFAPVLTCGMRRLMFFKDVRCLGRTSLWHALSCHTWRLEALGGPSGSLVATWWQPRSFPAAPGGSWLLLVAPGCRLPLGISC